MRRLKIILVIVKHRCSGGTCRALLVDGIVVEMALLVRLTDPLPRAEVPLGAVLVFGACLADSLVVLCLILATPQLGFKHLIGGRARAGSQGEASNILMGFGQGWG